MIVMNKLNEGVHVDGVNGILWFRPLDENSKILVSNFDLDSRIKIEIKELFDKEGNAIDFNWDLTNTITNFCETYDFDKEED